MKDISAIFSTFSAIDKNDFSIYLKNRNRRGDVKNLQLLKFIEEGKTKNLDVLLYGKPSKGAFHALCKRVLDVLIEFVASKSFAEESSNESEALKLLLASRLFFEQKLYRIAFKTLNKAEVKAKNLENYSILNEIYLTKIQHAYLNDNWLLQEIVLDYEKNKKLFDQDFQLNMAYAKIKLDLKSSKNIAINTIVIEAFSKFHLEINKNLTYKSLYQLMEITATTAKLQNNFYSISPFMMDLYETVKQKGAVPKKYTYYYINILYLMAVTKFRNKQFASSKELVSKIYEELSISKKIFRKVFDEKLTILSATNETYTGNFELGIKLLENGNDSSLSKKLLLVTFLFQQEKYAEAYRNLLSLNKTDDWYQKKMSWIWVLKKNIIEILLLIELDKLDLVLMRLQRFSKKFNKKLVEIKEERVLTFIKLVKEYYESPAVVTTEEFKEKVEVSFEWLSREQEDIFVMSFYSWLKSKMENRNLYQVTLELVGSSDKI